MNSQRITIFVHDDTLAVHAEYNRAFYGLLSFLPRADVRRPGSSSRLLVSPRHREFLTARAVKHYTDVYVVEGGVCTTLGGVAQGKAVQS